VPLLVQFEKCPVGAAILDLWPALAEGWLA
jgi:hypothetical protein